MSLKRANAKSCTNYKVLPYIGLVKQVKQVKQVNLKTLDPRR